MKKTTYLSLGTNKGDRKDYLEKALILLDHYGYVSKVSSYYETEPYGVSDQDLFINIVCKFEIDLSPEKLLKTVKKIEKKLKRSTLYRWGPREIDIDIIYYEDKIIESKELTIPHKEFFKRNFVLIPLCEIEPDLYLFDMTASTYLELCRDKLLVTKVNL
jgi:2-amino-4-hydroxy-6-hydroxymethyldihydropteridine diphosphokinase